MALIQASTLQLASDAQARIRRAHLTLRATGSRSLIMSPAVARADNSALGRAISDASARSLSPPLGQCLRFHPPMLRGSIHQADKLVTTVASVLRPELARSLARATAGNRSRRGGRTGSGSPAAKSNCTCRSRSATSAVGVGDQSGLGVACRAQARTAIVEPRCLTVSSQIRFTRSEHRKHR